MTTAKKYRRGNASDYVMVMDYPGEHPVYEHIDIGKARSSLTGPGLEFLNAIDKAYTNFRSAGHNDHEATLLVDWVVETWKQKIDLLLNFDLDNED